MLIAAVLPILAVLATAPAITSPEVERARTLFEAGKTAEARAILEPRAKAGEEDPEPAVYFYLGRIAMREGKHKEAVRWFEAAAQRDDRSAIVQLWLGRAYGEQAAKASVLHQPGLAKKTKQHFDRAVALDPDMVEAREDLIEYYVRAPGFLGGSVPKALEQVEEIRRRDPYRGHLVAARLAERQKQWDEVERHYQAAAKAYPDSLDVSIALGQFFARTERWERAFETFEGVLKTHPENRNALYQVGRTGALSGQRLEQAVKALVTYLASPASDRSPPHSAAQWRLGMIYEKQGRKDLARRAYQTAIQLEPPQEEARKALAKLK